MPYEVTISKNQNNSDGGRELEKVHVDLDLFLEDEELTLNDLQEVVETTYDPKDDVVVIDKKKI